MTCVKYLKSETPNKSLKKIKEWKEVHLSEGKKWAKTSTDISPRNTSKVSGNTKLQPKSLVSSTDIKSTMRLTKNCWDVQNQW